MLGIGGCAWVGLWSGTSLICLCFVVAWAGTALEFLVRVWREGCLLSWFLESQSFQGVLFRGTRDGFLSLLSVPCSGVIFAAFLAFSGVIFATLPRSTIAA